MEEKPRRDVLTTTEGREIHLRPVSQLLLQKITGAVERELRAAGEPLDPPTYTVVTASGAEETHAHDEASLATDEDRAAWAKYQAARVKLSAATNERSMRVLLLRGLDVSDPPDEWAEAMLDLGIMLPIESGARKLEYIQTEALKTPADIKGAIVRIMQLSMAGMAEEDVAAVEGMFRDSMARNAAK